MTTVIYIIKHSVYFLPIIGQILLIQYIKFCLKYEL